MDRNFAQLAGPAFSVAVALRKESVDRNSTSIVSVTANVVALRKESVDRNAKRLSNVLKHLWSLSARRAWIEILFYGDDLTFADVALRKESVDRNDEMSSQEIFWAVALRKESVDRNTSIDNITQGVFSRSPQGERG